MDYAESFKWLKKLGNFAIFIAFVLIGFLIGRQVIETGEKTVYVKEEPISETITGIEPVVEERPEVSALPVKRDTFWRDSIRYVIEKVDTAAIIAEYEMRRFYQVLLFDNNYGKLDVSMNSQYNRLGDVSYTFVPIVKEVIRYRERVWQPYVAASFSTLSNSAGIGGGVFYKSIGFEYQYQRAMFDSRFGHQFGLKWKF